MSGWLLLACLISFGRGADGAFAGGSGNVSRVQSPKIDDDDMMKANEQKQKENTITFST